MPKCKQCGAEIGFSKLPSGKWRPTEPDGSDHFDRCSYLRSERVRLLGKEFADESGSGHIFQGKKVYSMISSDWITGKDYSNGCDHCSVPPWEDCACIAEPDPIHVAHIREILST